MLQLFVTWYLYEIRLSEVQVYDYAHAVCNHETASKIVKLVFHVYVTCYLHQISLSIVLIMHLICKSIHFYGLGCQ